MAANVEKMFSVRIAPWHLGVETTEEQTKVIAEYPGREEAMKLAGHDFLVEEEPQYRRVVRKIEVVNEETGQVEEREEVSFVKVEGFKFLVNNKSTENNKVLHSARDTYVVVQPGILYDLTEAILEADDKVLYETAGTLKDGAVLWTLAKVDKPFYVTGDDSPIYPFVAASTTNDGTGGVKVQNINTRIVCWNTWNVAQGETAKSGREFTFRHTKNVATRIEEAKKILAGATAQASAFRELGEELVNITFTDKAIKAFVEEFIPEPPGEVISDRVKANIADARGLVLGLFDSKSINADIRNTGYGALQVGVEYLDHLRRYRNDATYLGRTLLRPEPLKEKLVPMIRRIADDNKVGALV